MKIVINVCFGGFGVSASFLKEIGEESVTRTDERLIKAVEKNARDVEDSYSSLRVVEIPDDHICAIEEYDGVETIYSGPTLFVDGKQIKESQLD